MPGSFIDIFKATAYLAIMLRSIRLYIDYYKYITSGKRQFWLRHNLKVSLRRNKPPRGVLSRLRQIKQFLNKLLVKQERLRRCPS